MKILFVASVYRHMVAFHIPYMKKFQDNGYEVYVAASGEGKVDKGILESEGFQCIDVPFERNPFGKNNFRAYKQLKNLFINNHFDLVHVHTPTASFLTRFAFRKSIGGKIIYTAHGFHFFKGAPKLNWLIYYSAEKFASKYTDHLITINTEDFNNAQKLIDSSKISLVHGVGVERIEHTLMEDQKREFRNELGLAEDAFIISYIAELNQNKNHHFILSNWHLIKQNNSKATLLIIGTGELDASLKEYVKNNKLEDVHFLGFRTDVTKLLQISDVGSLLSYREGLPKSIMEAMMQSLPCVVSNTRGLRDLIQSNENGFVVDLADDKGLVEAFERLNNRDLRAQFANNTLIAIKQFELNNVLEEYKQVYEAVLNKKLK